MLHTWDNDVVVGVSIILDQGTAVVVASEFNGVRVDGVDRGQESLTFVHNHGSVGVNGGSSNLRIDMGANLHVTSDHGKFNSVGAQGSLDVDIFVHVVVHVLVHVVVIVVVIIVGFLVDVGDQIVVGIAIIGDKSATMIVAGDLELVGGNLVHRGSIGLAVNLDSDGLVVEGGGGQLRVGVGVHIDVSSVDVELHAVSAHGLVVIVTVVVVSIVVLLVVSVVVVLTVLISVMLVGSWERVSERQLSLSAGKDGSARSDHLRGKGELLAVKDQGVLVVVKVVLGIGASILSCVHAAD